jgi:hypothetical protein
MKCFTLKFKHVFLVRSTDYNSYYCSHFWKVLTTGHYIYEWVVSDLSHHLWRILWGSVDHKIHYVTCSSFTPLQFYHSSAPFLSTREWPHSNKGLKIPRQLTSGNRSSLHNMSLLLWIPDNGRVDKPCNYNIIPVLRKECTIYKSIQILKFTCKHNIRWLVYAAWSTGPI